MFPGQRLTKALLLTRYMPFKEHNIGKGASVGVIGIGGLGHLAVSSNTLVKDNNKLIHIVVTMG